MNTVTSSVKIAAKATTSAASSTVKTAAKAISTRERDYTWEELESIEKRRRAILKRTEEPFWGILAHWDGTVLPSILQNSLFWITVVIYIVIRVWARTGIPDYVVDLGSGDIAVIGGFLSFFLVFYVNQSNSRFFSLYDCSMACKGRILDAATLVVASLPPEVACRVVRYMNAAHVAGYTGLSKTYPASSFFAQLNKNLGLLTDKELSRLQDIDLDAGGSCYSECIAWAMNDVQNQYREGVIDAQLTQQLRDMLLQLRSSFSAIYNAADLVCVVSDYC
jgi:predicted membrane chloride channel (bestrophin family)